MKKLLKQSITILFIMSSIFIESVNAQPGFLDLPFGNNGVTAIQYSGYGYSKIIELSNQKISGVCNGFLYDRYNSDGTPDESFGNNGRIYLPSGNISSNTVGVAELLNGDVVIGGWYALSSVQINILLIKCKSDGSIDSSFGKNGMATMDIDKRDYAEAMVLQPDGKIIISGEVGKNENDQLRTFMARFNTDGSIDNSFGDNGKVVTKFDAAVTSVAIALQPDGKIYSGGTYGLYFSRPSYYVMSYNPDGSTNNNFGENGRATYTFGVGQGSDDWANELHSIAIQQDGKIICAGHEGDYKQFSYDMGIVRFNANGSVDNAYGNNGTIVIPYPDHYSTINSLSIQPDGKLVACGAAMRFTPNAEPMILMRFLDNGDFDPGFGINGMQTLNYDNYITTGNTSFLQTDNKILVGGLSDHKALLARYNGDNVLAANFKEVKAAQNNDAITITWQTLNEDGMKSFTVERSMNANSYVGINTVPAKGVASIYNYTDKNPLDGISYYRIRENAANGTNTFSPVVKVVFNSTGIISLYPNPAKNTVTVKGLNKNINAVIKITDMQGREISSQNFTQSSSATLNIRALAQGTYFVQVAQEGKIVRLKMVKE